MAGSRVSLAPPGTALPCFLGLRVCGDPTGTLTPASSGRTGARSHSLCAPAYRAGRGLGQEVELLSDLPGDPQGMGGGDAGILGAPPQGHTQASNPSSPSVLDPCPASALDGVPDFVPSRVFALCPLCPLLLSLSATCLGPSAGPSSSLLLLSTTLSPPPSRGEALPGEGCGLSPAASLASASPLPATAAGHSKSSEESGAGSLFVPPRGAHRPGRRRKGGAPAGSHLESPRRNP